jgi:sulfur relay (sulfurtransferase) DsrC/TusE family protein
MLESISLSDQHWPVIDCLRTQYLKHGEAAGIVVHQGMTSNVQNSKELHAITTW